MAVPKRKVSPSRRNMRRSHHALGANSYVEDKETGELKRPHHVDLKTGMYKGRQVITGRRGVSLIQELPVIGRVKCERCLACITGELRRRKEAKERFEALLYKIQGREPAIAQQIGMAWPAHAREDNSAEWWETSAPAMIQDMKEALRGGGNA